MAALCLFSTLLFSCKPEPEDPTDIVVEYPGLSGLYVHGTNTIASKPESAGKVSAASLDPARGGMVDSVSGIYGRFMYVGANSTLNVTLIENGNGKTYGITGGGASDSASTVGGNIADLVIHGTLVVDADPVSVAKEGLYYLFVNMNDKSLVLMEVKANIIGDATALQWDAGTRLPLSSVDVNQTVFDATDIPLKGAAGYRYRFNEGWNVFNDINNLVTLNSLGVLSYADAWAADVNDLGYFLDNIPQKDPGVYTVRLTYSSLTQKWNETKIKTGELTKDYSAASFGWFGNGYFDTDSTEGAWDTIDMTALPVKNGNVFTWSWRVKLIDNRSFVLRQAGGGEEWVTYSIPQKSGLAFTNNLIIQEAGQDNFFVQTAGIYLVTFSIDATNESRSLTIDPE